MERYSEQWECNLTKGFRQMYEMSYCKYSALGNTCSSISNDSISRTDELPVKYSLSIRQEPLRSKVPFCRKQLATLSRFQTEHSENEKHNLDSYILKCKYYHDI